MENLPDYIYLNIANAVVSNNKYTWSIPYSYYGQNSRGQICFISLVDAYIYQNVDDGIIIKYENGVLNMIDTQNSPGAYIGQLSMNEGDTADNRHNFFNQKEIKLLTESKPQQITISTWLSNDTAQTVTKGFFVVKFEYYNQDESIKNYKDTQYYPHIL